MVYGVKIADRKRFVYLTYQQLLRLCFRRRRRAALRAYNTRWYEANQIYKCLVRLAFPAQERAKDAWRNNPAHPNYTKRLLYSRAIKRNWARRNPAYCLAICRKRQARQRQVTIGDTGRIAKIYERAAELRQWFDVVVDHRIPLCKGGAHSPENLQIIYAFENARKGARLDYKPSVVFR